MLKKLLQQVLRKPKALESRQKALSAGEKRLNQEIVALARVAQGHTASEFQAFYKALFLNVLEAASMIQGARGATSEAITADILTTARRAAALRRGRLLPAGRPNANYRQYERVYTYALVSAVAVEGVMAAQDHTKHEIGAGMAETGETPSEGLTGRSALGWAEAIIPQPGLAWLKEDSLVWSDWLAFFDPQADSLMAEIATQAASPTPESDETPSAQPSRPSAEAALAQVNSQGLKATTKTRATQAGDLAGSVIWDALKAALASGELPCNGPDGLVQVDRDGRTFLRTPNIYAWYIEKEGISITHKEVHNRLNRMKIFVREKGKDRFWGKTSSDAKQVAGVVLKDSSLLWGDAVPAGSFVISARS